MSNPRDHHFVAQLHQRWFADAGGELFHYDKRAPEKGVGHDGPKGIFYEEHFYSAIDYRTGNLDPAVELFYSREVEDRGARVIKRIILSARSGRCPELSATERKAWDRYLYFQIKRSPDFIRPHIDAYETGLLRGTIEDESGGRPLTTGERASIAMPQHRSELTRNVRVHVQGTPSSRVFAALESHGLRISVIDNPDDAFIIGSNPVVLRTHAGEKLWLPISSDVAVSAHGLRGHEELCRVADRETVRQLNEQIFAQSTAIAGRSRDLITSLVAVV